MAPRVVAQHTDTRAVSQAEANPYSFRCSHRATQPLLPNPGGPPAVGLGRSWHEEVGPIVTPSQRTALSYLESNGSMAKLKGKAF